MSVGTRRRMLAATTGLLAVAWTLTACELPIAAPAPSTGQSGSAAPEPTGSAAPKASASAGTTTVGDFCSLFEKDQALLMGIAKTGSSAIAGVDKVRAKKNFQAILNAAPADLRTDMQVIVAVDLDLLDGKPGAEIRLDSPDVEAAVAHTDLWTRTNC
ncbi:hypothetical protein AB0M43_03110 [Longispora sp. NPDC051575]|uniref:hypothetical protein n=1 Tax=Longispora sp. NPDC051575 TaxID=3154943 RepID=UPI00342811AA